MILHANPLTYRHPPLPLLKLYRPRAAEKVGWNFARISLHNYTFTNAQYTSVDMVGQGYGASGGAKVRQ